MSSSRQVQDFFSSSPDRFVFFFFFLPQVVMLYFVDGFYRSIKLKPDS